MCLLDFRKRAKANDVPVGRLIGFEARDIADGRATVVLAAGPQHANRRGEPICRESGFHLHGASRPEGIRMVIPTHLSSAIQHSDLAPNGLPGCHFENFGLPLAALFVTNILDVLRRTGLFCHLIEVIWTRTGKR